MRNLRVTASCNLLRALLLLPGAPRMLDAQVADSIQALPLVDIRDTRFGDTGFARWKADSLPANGILNLTERLFWENPLDVRSNAPGTLATLSARGLGPTHTPVFWYGLNLQSPMNGVVDASLLPLWPGDRLEVRFGGQSTTGSSGAMGGAVSIEPRLPETPGFSVSASAAAGSFKRRDAMLEAGWQTANWTSLWRGNWQQADNDFPFRNTTQLGKPQVRQPNNRLEKWDLQQFNRWPVNARNTLETAFWRQSSFREIPPAMTEMPAESWQRDRATRAVLRWEHRTSRQAYWHQRLAWMQETLYFRLRSDTDTSRAHTGVWGAEYSAAAGPQVHWKAGASGIFQTAQVDGYADSTYWYRQGRAAAYAMLEWRLPKGRITALARQEWTDQRAAPFTWTLGGQFRVAPGSSLRMHASRNFNLPTLNDRFWRTLGKNELLPESGYSADLGLVFQKNTKPVMGLSAEAGVFNLLIDNWILWQPDSSGIFRPGNLRQVWSRGLEAAIQYFGPAGKGRFTLSARYRLARTTNTKAYDNNSDILRKQLPYVPAHTGSLTIGFVQNRFSATYLHHFTGSRYTSSDNRSRLPFFSTGNVLCRYRVSAAWAFDARLENCWNTAYTVIAYRPMPGLSWRAGIQWFMTQHPLRP